MIIHGEETLFTSILYICLVACSCEISTIKCTSECVVVEPTFVKNNIVLTYVGIVVVMNTHTLIKNIFSFPQQELLEHTPNQVTLMKERCILYSSLD